MRFHDRLLVSLYIMSLSRHFPPSTQAILSAQLTPPAPSKKHRDHSIIIISSSPDEVPESVICSSDEEYFGPARATSPPILKRRKSRQKENVLTTTEVEDKSFSRFLGDYKYALNSQNSRPLTDPLKIPGGCIQKVNLDGLFPETNSLPTVTKSRVKTTLTTRVALPKRPSSTKVPISATPSDSREHARCFTTWAAAQAPTVRAKPTAKPRRKTTSKRSPLEVVLLSPRTGQESVRKRVVEEKGEWKLGERSEGESMMWDACKRGSEGELYDCEGQLVFSQELRRETSVDEDNHCGKERDLEVLDVTESQEIYCREDNDIANSPDKQIERGEKHPEILDERHASPDIPLDTLANVSFQLPPEIRSHFDESFEVIDLTSLQHPPSPNADPFTPTTLSPKPNRRNNKVPAAQGEMPNYSTYTILQLQVPLRLKLQLISRTKLRNTASNRLNPNPP